MSLFPFPKTCGKNLCLECSKVEAKGTKALGCGRCGKWLYVGCGVLEEADLEFMSADGRLALAGFVISAP